MLRKTDRIEKRRVRLFERGHFDGTLLVETVRRETWWLLLILPILSIETIVKREVYD